MNERTREYLDLYSRLEKAIRDRYPVPSGEGALAWLARNDRDYRNIKDELDYCREVRNFLSHNESVNDDYAVIPSEGMVQTMRNNLSRVAEIPKAIHICTKTRQLYSVSLQDRIRPAMRTMARNSYTHVPILQDGFVVGVFSENTLVAHMNTDEVVEITEDDTFEKMKGLLPLDKHVGETFRFVSEGLLATEIAEMFLDALKRRERLCMVFVTANGKQREKLLGIITAWDMADFF